MSPSALRLHARLNLLTAATFAGSAPRHSVEQADLLTSCADWRELLALRVNEDLDGLLAPYTYAPVELRRAS